MKLAMALARALLLSTICAALTACWSRKWPDDRGTLDRLQRRLDEQAGVIDFATLAPFHWSKLEIFGAYSSRRDAERRLGFEWPYAWPGQLEANEGLEFFVFLDSGKVVAAFEFGGMSVRHPYRALPRDSARFIVDQRKEGWKYLRWAEPAFESDLWPGEGIPIIEGARDSLLLYAAPREGLQPIAVRTAQRGKRVRFDSTRYQTLEGRVIQMARTDSISGRSYGSVQRITRDHYYGGGRDTVVTHYRVGTLEVMQYRAEGECLIRAAEIILAARCTEPASLNWDTPRTLWWAWTPGPGAAGWFIVSDSTAKVVDRRF